MALTNYSDLQAYIADHLSRSDVTSQIQDFIVLAESECNKEIVDRQMLTSTTLATVADTKIVALPTDYLQASTVVIDAATDKLLQFVSDVQ